MYQYAQPRGRNPSSTIGRNLEPYLLLELVREPSYGYDLIRRVSAFGFHRAASDSAVVYKMLRALEDAGSISSAWSTERSGPARRYYAITDQGRAVLRAYAASLAENRDRIERFLQIYGALIQQGTESQCAADEPVAPIPVVSSAPGAGA